MKIAVLALQGAFAEHAARLGALGAEVREVRQLADWQQGGPWDGLVLPGGESTVMRRLMHELGLYAPLRRAVGEEGLPVLGTCAGLILLAARVEGDGAEGARYPTIGTMDITVCRNAYGRQLGSFRTEASCLLPRGGAAAAAGAEAVSQRLPMTFIRAPYVREAGPGVQVLATVGGRTVAVRQGRQLAVAFHPELDADPRLHDYFLREVCGQH